MKYCARCLYPATHPLHITFDDDGVCSGCRIHEEKDVLDWQERAEKLKEIFAQFRYQRGSGYDCIIPVSGGKDSYFIVHTVKNVFGMNPLLVSYNKQYNTSVGIRNYAYLKTLFDCDAFQKTVSPELAKKITRYTLEKKASIYWHILAGQTVLPVQVAVQYKIPLIVWGAHQGCDQVGMFSHLDEVEMTRKYRKDHDLMGLEAEDIVRDSGDITEAEMTPFRYPDDKEIEAVGVRGIYLNNYIRWDSKAQHEDMIRLYGYETALQQMTFDTYNDIDCFHYSGLHDYIKYIKHGYGKATDHACREIRLKRLTREEGLELVKKYSGLMPTDIPLFLDWLGISETELFGYLNRFRNPQFWRQVDDDKWELHAHVDPAWVDQTQVDRARLQKQDGCEFSLTPHRKSEVPGDRYTLIGRGFVDPS